MEGSLANLSDDQLQAEIAARQAAAGTAADTPVDTPADTPAVEATPLEQAQDALQVAQAQLADALTLLGQIGK